MLLRLLLHGQAHLSQLAMETNGPNQTATVTVQLQQPKAHRAEVTAVGLSQAVTATVDLALQAKQIQTAKTCLIPPAIATAHLALLVQQTRMVMV
jgi:hypothetical protein